MLIDTHAHLWWLSYEDDLDQVITRAKENGVEKIIVPGTDLRTSQQAVELAKKYPEIIYAAVGIHPEELLNVHQSQISNVHKLKTLIEENRELVVAVGEIGTDANTEELRETMPAQKELFREQLGIAAEFGLPVIIHTRESLMETLEVLDDMTVMPKGQFHCFSYDEEGLQEVLKRGFYISFCGNISWSKRVRKLVKLVPEERLLLETDSPFMMPRDKKGEPLDENLQNEPKNVRMLAQFQAELRGVTVQVLEQQTMKNTKKLYGI